MPDRRLALYELLAPQFLAGFTFPSHIDAYLSKLSVDELATSFDATAVVYRGKVSFGGLGGAAPLEVEPVREHRDPAGRRFRFLKDARLEFRLTLPREGSSLIEDAADLLTQGAQQDPDLAQLPTLLQQLGAPDAAGTDFPSLRFRLELMLSEVAVHLDAKKWLPAVLTEDGRVVRDTSDDGDVRFVLPKVVFEYEQDLDLLQPPVFRLKSWGASGFEAPHDLAQGELVRMEPPLAINPDSGIGFGLDQVLLDLSPDHTPPEILQLFGTDEGFEGLYVKNAAFFYSDVRKDLALSLTVTDVLVSFGGEVSLEAQVTVLGPSTALQVELLFFDDGLPIPLDRSNTLFNLEGFFEGTRARLSVGGEVHVRLSGGTPPYTVTARLRPEGAPAEAFEELAVVDERQFLLSPGAADSSPTFRAPGVYELEIEVSDSTAPEAPADAPAEERKVRRAKQILTLDLFDVEAVLPPAERDGAPEDQPDPPTATDLEPVRLEIDSITVDGQDVDALPAGYSIDLLSGSRELGQELLFFGGDGAPTVQLSEGAPGGLGIPAETTRRRTLEVPQRADAETVVFVTASYPAVAAPIAKHFDLFFKLKHPTPQEVSQYVGNLAEDTRFEKSAALEDDALLTGTGAARLRAWAETVLQAAPGGAKEVTLEGHASFEKDSNADSDLALSENRVDVARGILEAAGISVVGEVAHGHAVAKTEQGEEPARFRRVTITGERVQLAGAVIVQARLVRPARPEPVNEPAEPKKRKPPTSVVVPPPPKKPPFFRRLSVRTRLERNRVVLFEIKAKVDFETPVEKALRNGTTIPDTNTQELDLKAVNNPENGVVDVKLLLTYDPAQDLMSETLTLGAGAGDTNGLLTSPRFATTGGGQPAEPTFLRNVLGAVMVMSPILAAASEAIAPEAAGDWVTASLALGLPATLATLGGFTTERLTLFGGELATRHFLPPEEAASGRFLDAALLFDYGVAFHIKIPSFIETQKAIEARYRAVGVRLGKQADDTFDFQPVFDTSRGYELDLSQPGLFKLPGPLDGLLKVESARIARFNPLTLEADLGLSADLGVVSVEKIKVKWPIADELGPPTVTPAAAGLEIPGALVAKGYFDPGRGPSPSGQPAVGPKGALDVTIVPLKLRAAASFALDTVEDAASGRRATAVLAALNGSFGSPVVLGASGLGLYGFSGLFAMHYQRNEPARLPGSAVPPALAWLAAAKGDPGRLTADGVTLWNPALDRWSFGLGVVLGSLDGGRLLNIRGSLVVEVPGPRLLVFAKAQMLSALPKLGDGNLTQGMLGVLDVDVARGQLTVGLLASLEVEKLLAVKVPAEAFFDAHDRRNWHLYVGTLAGPASAKVLGVERARGYFMIDGKEIAGFPTVGGPVTLPGLAVAAGVAAPMLFGDPDGEIYLKAALRADLGVSFSPFFLSGNVALEGALHLFVVDLQASARLALEAPNPTILRGEVCGAIDLGFFRIEGCVPIQIGSGERVLPAPPLVRGLFLQSHAPVIAAGQGGDRPIDLSLGAAVAVAADGSVDPAAELPRVPVDSVPVLQLHAAPRVNQGGATPTFTLPLATPPGPAGGWLEVGGGRRLRYHLREIAIDPPLPASTLPLPATWRQERAPGAMGADTNLDLALGSRAPVAATHAVERSTELTETVLLRWEGLCQPPAPATSVLWTFGAQPFGPAPTVAGERGWDLRGTAADNGPGTLQAPALDRNLAVREPAGRAADALLDLLLAEAGQPVGTPARVVGTDDAKLLAGRAVRLPERSPGSKDAGLVLERELAERAAAREDGRRLTFETGACAFVRCFVAVDGRLLAADRLLLRQLDAAGRVLAEKSVADLDFAAVGTAADPLAGLPSEWVAVGSPWRAQVEPVARLFASAEEIGFAGLTRGVFKVAPEPEAVALELAVIGPAAPRSSVLVGVVEALRQLEVERAADDLEVQRDEIATVQSFLGDESVSAIFAPDTLYTLTVRYDAESQAADGSTSTEAGLVQRFRFATDAAAPARLDPWVLATTPAAEDRHHFWGEPVRLVLNDLSVPALWAAYGQRLRANLRGADGLPVPGTGAPMVPTPQPGTFGSSYRDTLAQLANDGLLPCVGTASQVHHGRFTLPVELQPSMPYTLDVEAVAANGSALPVPDGVRTPLFRRAFTTSRYRDAQELAAAVRASGVGHRALARPLGSLPAGPPTTVLSEAELQELLAAAGADPLAPPRAAQARLYWARPAGAARFQPAALLLDSPEPLWRERVEPRLETVPDQDDPAFQRVVATRVADLELVERVPPGQAPAVTRILRTTDGYRTLFVFADDPAPVGPVALHLRRSASELLGVAAVDTPVLRFDLAPSAPWESDNV